MCYHAGCTACCVGCCLFVSVAVVFSSELCVYACLLAVPSVPMGEFGVCVAARWRNSPALFQTCLAFNWGVLCVLRFPPCGPGVATRVLRRVNVPGVATLLFPSFLSPYFSLPIFIRVSFVP